MSRFVLYVAVYTYVGMHTPMLPMWGLEEDGWCPALSSTALILSRQDLSQNPELGTFGLDWTDTKT